MRRYDRAKHPSSGVGGGHEGRPSRFVITDGDGDVRDMPSSGRFEMKAGDAFYLEKAGGGGYGPAEKRDAEAIQRDLAEGYITPEGAARDYGKKG